jgi:two-component system chemotaxis sensor kinase CheA
VVEIVSVARREVNSVQGRQVARVRERVISLLRLGELLSYHGDEPPGASGGEETTLVIVGEAGKAVGLAVDRVLGEEDVVIKSIAENYRNVAGVAGASILGDGRVALILDVPALIAAVSRGAAHATC